jgi:hypothetical protein
VTCGVNVWGMSHMGMGGRGGEGVGGVGGTAVSRAAPDPRANRTGDARQLHADRMATRYRVSGPQPSVLKSRACICTWNRQGSGTDDTTDPQRVRFRQIPAC